ncbi:MAG: hypothetical protein AABX02_03645, partial [archaeon]
MIHPRRRLVRRAGLALAALGLVGVAGYAGHKYAQRSYAIAPSVEEHRMAIGIEGERPGYGRKEKYEAVRRGGVVNRFLFPVLKPAELFNMWVALPADARADYLNIMQKAGDRYIANHVKDSDVVDIENSTAIMPG